MFVQQRRSAARPASTTSRPEGVGLAAIGFLAEQGLEATPAHYALAWHRASDRDGLIATAVDAVLMEGRALTPADVERIMQGAAGRARGEAGDPHREALRHQTLRLADLATGAASTSSDFGRELTAQLGIVPDDATSLHGVVQAMIARTHEVEDDLRSASREIEALRQQVEASRDDAQRDALTGLLNRRGALKELAARKGRGQAVVALCDVDHFKAVNDRFGHGVGDRVLKGVAASLSESLGSQVVARWGGEEFLVVADCGVDAAAEVMLERARRDLEARSFRLKDTDEALGTVTVSIGLAALDDAGVEAAVAAADRSLYAAKEGGRNRVIAAWAEEAR